MLKLTFHSKTTKERCCTFIYAFIYVVVYMLLLCQQLLFDGHLSEAVLFSYNAKAVDGQLCLESSPIENPSPFIHSPHATLLEVQYIYAVSSLMSGHSTINCGSWETKWTIIVHVANISTKISASNFYDVPTHTQSNSPTFARKLSHF